MESRPLLAVTMGDAAGVGPEVIVGAWADAKVHEACRLVVIGHPEVLRAAIRLLGSQLEVQVVEDCQSLGDDPTVISCLPVGDDTLLDVTPGTLDRRTGQAAYEAVVRAAQGALEGEFQGLVTAPLSKAALQAAGHLYPGHTELLGELCGVENFAMMLYLPPDEVPQCPAGLGVVHTTLHMPLRDVFASLTPERILAKCHLAHDAMHDGFGLQKPRIAVCALNPHAGEDGLFGNEESHVIAPAVKMAISEGIVTQGPMPTDTLMGRARDGEFDAVVAMYHDQGHIALKLIGMHGAVNITLGLPIVRTSVAHGTAFDRAWQGSAEHSGMAAAILTAAQLASRR